VERTNYPEGVDPEDVDSVMRAMDEFPGPAVSEHRHHSVGRVADLCLLLSAIERLLPRPAVIFIEGTKIAGEVKTFLDEHSIASGRDDLWGTAWPRPEGFHILVTDENLRGLRHLVSTQVRPEEPYPYGAICNHVVVYRDNEILLTAYDVGSEVWLSDDLPAGTAERFREVVDAEDDRS
jgi:hypothetical protein